MAKKINQEFFLEIKEKLNTHLENLEYYYFEYYFKEIKMIRGDKMYNSLNKNKFDDFFDKKVYCLSKEQKNELIKLIDSHLNKNEAKKEEIEEERRKIKEEKYNRENSKENLQKIVEDAKVNINLDLLENIEFYSNNRLPEEVIERNFWNYSEEKINIMLKNILPINDGSILHRNITSILWFVKKKQQIGVKFTKSNFDWSLLVAQFKLTKM